MNEEDEKRIAAHLAKTIAMMCVRNTILEDIHTGLTPTRTGDYSDVVVIDADGREISWPEVSHFGDDAMWNLIRRQHPRDRHRAHRRSLGGARQRVVRRRPRHAPVLRRGSPQSYSCRPRPQSSRKARSRRCRLAAAHEPMLVRQPRRRGSPQVRIDLTINRREADVLERML